MKNYQRYTFEQHVEAAEKFKMLQRKLVGLYDHFRKHHPKEVCEPIAKKLDTICFALHDMRGLMEDELYRTHPDKASTGIYFGLTKSEKGDKA